MVTRAQADDIMSRMNTATGKKLDEDMEEFVMADADMLEVQLEVESLFDNPPVEGESLSDDNLAIINLMEFEKSKKQFIMDLKSEGMELIEAKQEYENAKSRLVRVALDLPEPEEEEELSEEE
jgi:hypothetical protein